MTGGECPITNLVSNKKNYYCSLLGCFLYHYSYDCTAQHEDLVILIECIQAGDDLCSNPGRISQASFLNALRSSGFHRWPAFPSKACSYAGMRVESLWHSSSSPMRSDSQSALYEVGDIACSFCVPFWPRLWSSSFESLSSCRSEAASTYRELCDTSSLLSTITQGLQLANRSRLAGQHQSVACF